MSVPTMSPTWSAPEHCPLDKPRLLLSSPIRHFPCRTNVEVTAMTVLLSSALLCLRGPDASPLGSNSVFLSPCSLAWPTFQVTSK